MEGRWVRHNTSRNASRGPLMTLLGVCGLLMGGSGAAQAVPLVIAVTKVCTDAPGPGQPITFSGMVTNPGSVDLSNVTCVDNPGNITVLSLPMLAAGASAAYSGSYLPGNVPTSTDTVTCTGTGFNGGTAIDSASATCAVATVTQTPTLTPTNTPTATPTNTPTATPTLTPTATPTPQPNGSSCGAPGQCASTFCVDGVCCDTACTDPLEKCNLPGEVGTCASAAAPAPALTPWGLLVAAILLVSVAGFALRHRMRGR